MTADDLATRKFARPRPNKLWATEHRARKDDSTAQLFLTRGRRIVGWPIDPNQDSTLVINALDMAIRNRRTAPGAIVHAG